MEHGLGELALATLGVVNGGSVKAQTCCSEWPLGVAWHETRFTNLPKLVCRPLVALQNRTADVSDEYISDDCLYDTHVRKPVCRIAHTRLPARDRAIYTYVPYRHINIVSMPRSSIVCPTTRPLHPTSRAAMAKPGQENRSGSEHNTSGTEAATWWRSSEGIATWTQGDSRAAGSDNSQDSEGN